MMTMDLSCPKEYESHVSEWEDGLPSLDDLTPLFQVLISPELASAFSITPDPAKTLMDVTRASEITLSNLCKSSLSSISNVQSFSHKKADELESEQSGGGLDEVRKVRRTENAEQVYSATEKDKDSCNEQQETSGSNTNVNANTKRARLVWTPQLHKRFVDAVAHLGIKKAVPKTIMQLMNVEGLTRENVASHLQKYRLYLKRMQGLSNGGPTPSDELFASTPVPPSFREALGGRNVAVPMTYGATMMPGHSGMLPGVVAFHGYDPNQYKPREHQVVVPFHGFGSNQYNLIREQPRDWSGNKFGSSMLHHVNPHCN